MASAPIDAAYLLSTCGIRPMKICTRAPGVLQGSKQLADHVLRTVAAQGTSGRWSILSTPAGGSHQPSHHTRLFPGTALEYATYGSKMH